MEELEEIIQELGEENLQLKEKLEDSLESDGTLEMQYKIEAFKENHERFTSAEFEKLMKSYIR